MKIDRSGQINVNPYKQQQFNREKIAKRENKADEIQISKEALKLQEKNKPREARETYVQNIKHQIDTGQYKVDTEKTAEKMIDFWSNK